MLGKQRSRCHVYILASWAEWATMRGEQVFAKPAKTKAKQIRQDLTRLLDAIDGCERDSWSEDSVRWLQFVAWDIRNPDDKN